MVSCKFERSSTQVDLTRLALQIIFLIKDYKQPGQSLGQAVVHAAPFWLVLIMTCSIILPWLRLRKVPVESVVLSQHCVRFNFDYGQFLSRV